MAPPRCSTRQLRGTRIVVDLGTGKSEQRSASSPGVCSICRPYCSLSFGSERSERTCAGRLIRRASFDRQGHGGCGAEVIGPDGQRPLHSAKRVQRNTAGARRVLSNQICNGRDAVIGANPDRRESDLEPLPKDVQQLWSGNSSNGESQVQSTVLDEMKIGPYPLVVRYAACIGSCICRDGRRQRHGYAAEEELPALNSYIARLQQRLRLKVWLRGAATLAGTALLITLALVLVLNQFAFPRTVSVFTFRDLGHTSWHRCVRVRLLLIRLLGLQARAVRHAEAVTPELEQRLSTFHERAQHVDDPFLELLAADTVAYTQYAEPAQLVPDKRLLLGGAGLGLVWPCSSG